MMEIKNAKIIKTFLGREDHNIPTCMLTLDFGGSGQGFGGYDLRHHGYDMLDEIMKAVGVESWEDLKGTLCRVKAEHTKVHAIGHIIEERWYQPGA